jgi:serine phosphatase RsbU (regulator of sigma subunit)
MLLTGVFLLFSVIGFYTDLMHGGTVPYAIVLAIAVCSGICAVLWILTLARLRIYWVFVLAGLQTIPPWLSYLTNWIMHTFHPAVPAAEAGIHFAANGILAAVASSYFFLGNHMRVSGRETLLIRNELQLAHGIQKTLVPPIHRTTASFEIYGLSVPSEKVGGDLVDVVDLPGGDIVAYLADIAGHGLQAGILMGMLKTSARTVLAGGGLDGGAMLSNLMQTLNQVLPQVKEAHMYATFTALRLNADGSVFCGMAASPPVLHFKALTGQVEYIEREQFPLGLLPVTGFPADRLELAQGDLLVIATDGILEVAASARNAHGAEFGAEALSRVVAAHAEAGLPTLAQTILQTVHSFGKQLDDQTLLLVRRAA